jgi:ATP-dependent protease ClpP protease subunit
MAIKPDKSYRPDPGRAIYVTGTINDEMVTQLTPRILLLQSKSRDPITVYIDSLGGTPSSVEALLRLLNLTDQNSSDPCWIITVVTTRASSAAADLLSSGDYAIAFPSTTILHHGVRTIERDPLTLETTSLIGEFLRIRNDVYAMQLAQKIESRFSFRFVTVRQEFDELRLKKASPAMSELECFIEIIEEKLSDDAKKLWKKASQRQGRYRDLIATVAQNQGSSAVKSIADMQAIVIKAIVEFEVASNSNDPTWNFRVGGLSRVVDDFFLVNEYLVNSNHDRLKEWCTSFGKWSLTSDQIAAVDAIPDDNARLEKTIELVRPILQPIWTFFVALCHALQEGENKLTATDAFWLGLIDEVIGEDFMTVRDLNEYEDDPEEEAKPDEESSEAS